MKFFAKRSSAFLILAAVIILSTVFGVHRSLGPKVRAVEDCFNEGVYDAVQDYRLPGIRRQLEARSAASLNLLTVAAGYDELSAKAETLRAARGALQDGLDKNASFAELYDLNEELETSFNALYTALSLTAEGEDASNAASDAERMENAARLIETSGYNEQARAFNRETMGVFPTSFLKHIAFLNDAELFE